MKNENNLIKATVEEALPALNFRVVTESGEHVLAHLAGRLRLHRIRVVAGDTVLIELSPYDSKRGRIVRRF